MLGRLTFAIGFGTGYLLGAKAGVQRYDQIASAARALRGDSGASTPAPAADPGVDLSAGLEGSLAQAELEEAELDEAQRDGELDAVEADLDAELDTTGLQEDLGDTEDEPAPVAGDGPTPAELDIDAMSELELELATAPDLAPPTDPPARP